MPTLPAAGERILICVAWPYAHSATHVGQIAGSMLPGDIFARYQRMAGREVLMVSGSDMHGTPITVEADRQGVTPHTLAARYHEQISDVLRRLGISLDVYTSTVTENHFRQTQQIFLRLLEQGLLLRDTMESPYCPTDQRFLPDRYVEGICPYCECAEARGDQCHSCGRTLDPAQLLEPRCRLCGSQGIEIRSTEHFFLDLPQLQEHLRIWLAECAGWWRPNALNFALSWIRDGLRPRAITRDLEWGVPVPVPGFEDKRIYVWFDAVIGYLSASIEWAERVGQPSAWRQWWEMDARGQAPSRAYYFVGKDNIAFHTIFWPAILMGLRSLTLPYDVPANEYVVMGGAKASASRGNVIWTRDVLDRYGPDALRFYLASVLPESADTLFTYEELVRRHNDELLATYGNAAHRVLTFVQRHFGGRVPTPGALRPADQAVLAELGNGFTAVGAAIEAVRLREALAAAMAVARAANRYLESQAPWKRLRDDPGDAATSIFTMLQVLNGLKTLFVPFVPHSSQRLHELLGFAGDIARLRWAPESVPTGQPLPAPRPLFAKLEAPVPDGAALPWANR